MKRLLLAVCFVFFIPFLSFADEVDKGLPTDTSLRVKESARQVIQSGVEPDTVIKMTKSMIADSFSEKQIISGHELLIKAKKQDLAEEPIINKLYEGIAKDVAADRILQAMENVRSRYELANSYTQNLKADERQSEVMSKKVAECMAAGIDKGSMDKIVEMLQRKTKDDDKVTATEMNEKTLETARTMARAGVDSKDIVDVMNNAFKRNFNAGDMEKLGDTFMSQVRVSYSAPELARAYSDAIKNGATPDKLENYNPGMLSEGAFAGGSATLSGGDSPLSGGMASGSAPPSGGGSPPSGGMAVGSVPSADGGGMGAASAPPSGGGVGAAGTGGGAPVGGGPSSGPAGGSPGGR